MKQQLSSLLFLSEQQTEDVLSDIGKTITDTLAPLTKQVQQIGNDIKVIQQAQGQKKQEPTNARSTTGATKPTTTSIAKGPGTITPGSEKGKEGTEELSARIGDLTGKVDKIVSLIEKKEFGGGKMRLFEFLFEQIEYDGIGAIDWSAAFLDAHKSKPYNNTIKEIVTTGMMKMGLTLPSSGIPSDNVDDEKKAIIFFVRESFPFLTQAVGKDAVSVSFLGAGAIGLAFLVKDSDEHEFVFKIEAELGHGAETKDKKIPGFRQQRSGEPAGASQPMIYDHGSFRVFNDTITLNWFLIQKLETQSEYNLEDVLPYSLFSKLNDLFDGILRPHFRGQHISSGSFRFNKIDPKALERDMVRTIATAIKNGGFSSEQSRDQIETKLRLAGDWHVKLAQDIIHMAEKRIPTDFHAGNIGIQRNGPEGYLKFFD